MPRHFLLFFVLVTLVGCAASGGSGSNRLPPEATLVDIIPEQIGLLEQSLIITMRFVNPNPDDIAVDGLRVNLNLDGKKLGTGVSSEQFTLPRLGDVTTQVAIRVQTTDLIDRVVGLGQSDRVDYSLDGTLFGAGTLRLGLDFEANSSIQLPDLTTPAG